MLDTHRPFSRVIEAGIALVAPLAVLLLHYAPFIALLRDHRDLKIAIFGIVYAVCLVLAVTSLFLVSRGTLRVERGILIAYGLFVVYGAVRFIFTTDAISDHVTICSLVVGMPGAVVLSLAVRRHKRLVLHTLIGMGLIVLGFCALRLIISPQILWDRGGFIDWFALETTGYTYYQQIALILGLLSVLLTHRLLQAENGKRRILLTVALVSALTFLSMTGSCGVYLATGVCMILLIAWEGLFGCRRSAVWPLAAVVTVATVSVTVFMTVEPVNNPFVTLHRLRVKWGVPDPSQVQAVLQARATAAKSTDNGSSAEQANHPRSPRDAGRASAAEISLPSRGSARPFLFGKALELWRSSPTHFVFGAGPNSFPHFLGVDIPGYYPHNIVLELLAEYGLVGLVLFAAPFLVVLYRRRCQLGSLVGNTETERTIFVLAMFFVALFAVSGGIRTAWPLMFFLYLLFPAEPVENAAPSEPVCTARELGRLEAAA